MSVSDLDESTPFIHNYGIPIPVRDTRKLYQKRLAVYLILASTLFERIAFYTLAANLTLSLDSDKLPFWKLENPSIITFIFIGISNISAVIFAVISDAKLGRVKVILFGFIVYFIGYVLMTSSTDIKADLYPPDGFNSTNIPSAHIISGKSSAALIIIALIVIAFGAGAVQSNMAVFGAEQIQESKLTSRFFDKYVIVVNIGAMVAMFAVPSIQEKAEQSYIAYLVAMLALVLAAILFLTGRRYYVYVKPHDSVLTKCIPVVINAFQTWYKHKKNKRTGDYELTSNSTSYLRMIPHGLRTQESVKDVEQSPKFLDFAKASNSGKFIDRVVDDVKSFGSAIIVLILLIPYWLIYNQLHSTFRQQAQAMNGADVKQLIIVSLIDPITIVIGIFLLNTLIYSKLDARKWLPTLITKFVIGMCCGCITMCIAGEMEKLRRYLWIKGEDKSGLKVFTQLGQDIGMGFSEMFAVVASYEYAYFAAPRSAQSLFMSLRFCSIGISSFIAIGYVALFSDFSFDLDFSKYSDKSWPFYYYFFILAGLQLMFIFIFCICQYMFQIIKLNPQQIETSQFYRYESTAPISGR